MPAAPVFATQVYAAIANALDNSTLTTLVAMKPNRLRLDSPAIIGPLVSIATLLENAGDNDFPRWILWSGPDFGDSAFTSDVGFLNYDPAFNPSSSPWLDVVTDSVRLLLVHNDQTFAGVAQREADALAALKSLGPQLGLSFVKSWGPVKGRRTFSITPYTGGSERAQSDLVIPVTMFLRGSSVMP